jgi:peptidoglycan/LPS O-acetylase OafA/YrhL
VFLGEISYSVYLLQWFIWIGWKHILAKTSLFAPHPYLMVLAASLSIVGVSTISYFFFERPARIWLRKKLARRTPNEVLKDMEGGATSRPAFNSER